MIQNLGMGCGSGVRPLHTLAYVKGSDPFMRIREMAHWMTPDAYTLRNLSLDRYLPTFAAPDHPRLRGELTADVAIIGGGLTGCATAYACAAAGFKPVVIEADRLGQGGSGRDPGLLLPEPGPSFRDMNERHGLRTARRIFESWRRASLDAAALIRRLGISCGLEPCDHIAVASRDDGKALRREYEARTAAGLDAHWLTPAQVRKATALEASGAVKLGACFTLDPYRACLGLAGAAKSRGTTFFERSRVTKVRTGARQVEVEVAGGLVRAQTVVVCTGTATAEFKPLRRHFKPREQYLRAHRANPGFDSKATGESRCHHQ